MVDELDDEMDDELSVDGEATKENRNHPRFRLKQGVTIRLSNGDFARAQGVNISIGGIFIEYGAPADEGLVFDLCFDLPLSKEIKRVLVKGKVVRSIFVGSKSSYGIAFRFESFAKDTEEVLQEYIDMRSGQ